MSRSIDAGEQPILVTPAELRERPLPVPSGSKYARGQVIVVGGARRSPGAAMLAGIASLRVGAGRLTLAVGASVASHVAVAIPECGVVPLAETAEGHVDGSRIDTAADDLGGADAVVVGPGLDDADQAADLLERLPRLVSDTSTVGLDAYALGVLSRSADTVARLRGRLILTPNSEELARLLGRKALDATRDVLEVADRYGAVVSSGGLIASPAGTLWKIGTGTSGLATSGSGDVLAGAIAGLVARGATAEDACLWATYAHAATGDRLAVAVGPLGFLARELLDEVPRVLVEIGAAG